MHTIHSKYMIQLSFGSGMDTYREIIIYSAWFEVLDIKMVLLAPKKILNLLQPLRLFYIALIFSGISYCVSFSHILPIPQKFKHKNSVKIFKYF